MTQSDTDEEFVCFVTHSVEGESWRMSDSTHGPYKFEGVEGLRPKSRRQRPSGDSTSHSIQSNHTFTRQVEYSIVTLN